MSYIVYGTIVMNIYSANVYIRYHEEKKKHRKETNNNQTFLPKYTQGKNNTNKFNYSKNFPVTRHDSAHFVARHAMRFTLLPRKFTRHAMALVITRLQHDYYFFLISFTLGCILG